VLSTLAQGADPGTSTKFPEPLSFAVLEAAAPGQARSIPAPPLRRAVLAVTELPASGAKVDPVASVAVRLGLDHLIARGQYPAYHR